MRKLREQSGRTANDVAQALGVPTSTYREWEYGRAVRGEVFIKIAEEFRISVYELISGKKPETTDLLEQVHDIEQRLAQLRKALAARL